MQSSSRQGVGFGSSRANVIHAVSTRALRRDYALAARRLVSQAVVVGEQAAGTEEVVEEVDNVVQVLNQVGQVVAIVVAAPSRTTPEPASAVRARPAARPTVCKDMTSKLSETQHILP